MNELQFDFLKHVTGGLDRDAVLGELMREYGKDVWNFAFFLTRKRELADDIAQDVFVKVYERLYDFRGQSSVRTWLLAITRNTAIDALRSSWLKRVILQPVRIERSASPSAEEETMRRLAADELWDTVLKLPRKLREVLLLSSHYGQSMREIAELLGISEGTVKSRLHRARAAVNRKLARGAGGAAERAGDLSGEETWT
ncbi:RNA polymerase sigma factor [Paenibacillus aurantiacus]|uniref:RNA polymerase sigma factor n=1 Tax=Paenibacillus aurantiacus TaxID=1936118 RepID=A0ABV5KJJ2_9BACL